ncbi:hyalin, partial [bacterium]|nr:hyalin [bacterium]
GTELWKSDGTTTGTVMVKDIYNGSIGSSLSYLTAVGTTLYFSANDGTNGTELWKSNGTASGTVMVKDINNGSSAFYYPTWNWDNGSSVRTSPGCVPPYYGITAIGNTLYFQADDGTHGCELWKSNGTTNGTMMVKNINSGSGDSSPFSITAVGNTLYFFASDGTTGNELWRSDGTTFGTIGIKDINSGNLSSVPLLGGDRIISNIGNTIYFQADDGTNGTELWKSDGTTTGTTMVKDINSGSSSSFPGMFTAIGNTLYFSADAGTNGTELWKSDGTTTGTVMVKDINSGNASSFYFSMTSGCGRGLTAIGNTLYFSADDGTYGCELWKSDGTANGTMMIQDMNRGTSSSDPYGFIALGNSILFTAPHETRGRELFINHYEIAQVITYS